MSQRRLSPEEVIGEMTYEEIQELLGDLSMDSSPAQAVRLKRLVARLGRVEAAIEELMQKSSSKDSKAA